MIVNYVEICNTYLQNLETNLRGFEAGDGWLSDWAYDENLTRSLKDLRDQAMKAGLEILFIEMTQELIDKINPHEFYGTEFFLESLNDKLYIIWYSHHARNVLFALTQCCTNLGILPSFVLVGLKGDVATLKLKSEKFEYNLIKIERQLKENFNLHYNLQCENIEDGNKRG